MFHLIKKLVYVVLNCVTNKHLSPFKMDSLNFCFPGVCVVQEAVVLFITQECDFHIRSGFTGEFGPLDVCE